MNDPYQHGKHRRVDTPESDEDDDSKRMRTFGAHQDASTHHFYNVNRHQIQYQTQHTAQTQHTTQYAAQYPGQYMYPGHYGIQQPPQQPPQQLMQGPEEDPEEDSDEDSDEDQYEKASEDPGPYLYPPGSHQAQGVYQATGAEQVTEGFGGLSLAAYSHWGAQPAASQPGSAFQIAGTGSVLAAFSHPAANPFGSMPQQNTGFEQFAPGTEQPYGLWEDWEVRVGVARGLVDEDIARNARRTVQSVQHYIASNRLMWSQEHDDQLRELRVDQHSNMLDVQQRLSDAGNVGRLDDEVLYRARFLVEWDQFLARNPQLGPRQYPEVFQPGEAGAEAKSTSEEGRPWTDDEVRKLKEWKARHGRKWDGVEDEISGRSNVACRSKWYGMCYAEARVRPRHGRPEYTPPISTEDFDLIRVTAARGLSLQDCARSLFPAIPFQILQRAAYGYFQWSSWSGAEDMGVLALRKEGNDWAEICDKIPGPERISQEVMTRFEHLRGLQIQLAHGRSEFDFPTMDRTHARRIGLVWLRDDDKHLRETILQPGVIDDWDSIGKSFNPPRDGDIVKMHWDFLQNQR